MPTPTMLSAFLAGISIAFKNGYPPCVVLGIPTSERIRVGFIYVIGKAGGVSFFSSSAFLFRANRSKSTSKGTAFSEQATLAVFRHWLSTDRTWGSDSHAGRAHLVIFAVIVAALSAYLALNTNTPCRCRRACSTRYAGSMFHGLPQCTNCRDQFPAFRTWRKRIVITFIANPVVAAINTTNLASIFSHISNIPKLPKEGNSNALRLRM